MKTYLNTTRVLYLVLSIGTAGFAWTSFYPNAPYGTLVGLLMGALGVTGAKRTYEKIKGVDYTSRLGGGDGVTVPVPED